MIASHTLQLCVVHCVTHGVLNVTTAPTTDAPIPISPLAKRTGVGATHTSSNFSGNARLTRKMSANNSTIEMHQITVTAAWSIQKSLFVLPLPNQGPNAATVIADASTVCAMIAFTGTLFVSFTRPIAGGIRRSRPDTNSSRLNE